jgi:hypothetical protein
LGAFLTPDFEQSMLLFAVSLLTLCFPTVVIGPITAFGYIKVVQSTNRWWLSGFSLFLIGAYLISFQMMVLSWGHAFPGPGFGAYITLPLVAVITGIILFISGRRTWQTVMTSKRERVGYAIGAILILAFQLSAQLWFGLLSPILLDEWTVCRWLLQSGLACW